MEFFCSVCDDGHDFKTLKRLNEHKKTASHKRKVDTEFAAAEEAEKAAKKAAAEAKKAAAEEAEKTAKKDEFICSVCGNGHDFKTLQNRQDEIPLFSFIPSS